MYKLKCKPEDFIVEEISEVELQEGGRFAIVRMQKREYNTLQAIDDIAKALYIPPPRIKCAGNKDRHAVTTQIISIKDVNKERIEKITLENISLTVLGRSNEPISLGRLGGNTFTIIARNITKLPQKKTQFINYFGEQRFGRQNVDVGRALVKAEFKKACELLELNPKNPVNSLQQYSERSLKFAVHAYQSHLWNEIVKKIRDQGIDAQSAPMPGFGTEYENEELKPIIKEVLKEEGITKRSFIIRQLPDLSVEGDERDIRVTVKDFQLGTLEDDELHEGMKKCTLHFSLPKGCYATVFIDQLFT